MIGMVLDQKKKKTKTPSTHPCTCSQACSELIGDQGRISFLQNGAAAVENSMVVSQKFKHDPAIPPLGMYAKELKAGTKRDIYTSTFTADYPQ
jgi:hypothetical protein